VKVEATYFFMDFLAMEAFFMGAFFMEAFMAFFMEAFMAFFMDIFIAIWEGWGVCLQWFSFRWFHCRWRKDAYSPVRCEALPCTGFAGYTSRGVISRGHSSNF